MAQHKNGSQQRDLEKSRGTPNTQKVSKLGQRLRELSDKALASGTKTLSLEQIQQLISDIRGRSA
jgi:hypothetical protein